MRRLQRIEWEFVRDLPKRKEELFLMAYAVTNDCLLVIGLLSRAPHTNSHEHQGATDIPPKLSPVSLSTPPLLNKQINNILAPSLHVCRPVLW